METAETDSQLCSHSMDLIPIATVVSQDAGSPVDTRTLDMDEMDADMPEFNWKAVASTMMARRAYRRFATYACLLSIVDAAFLLTVGCSLGLYIAASYMLETLMTPNRCLGKRI